MKYKIIIILLLILTQIIYADGESLPGIPKSLQYQLDKCSREIVLPEFHEAIGIASSKTKVFILQREYGNSFAFAYFSSGMLPYYDVCENNQDNYNINFTQRLKGCFIYLVVPDSYTLIGGYRTGKYGGDNLLLSRKYNDIETLFVRSWYDFEKVEICY